MTSRTGRIQIPIVLIRQLLTFVILVGLALLIGAAAVTLTNESPLIALQELIKGAIGTRTNTAATLTRAIPIIICGIAAGVGFKAGQFNLGIEGQMVSGALAGAVIANSFQALPPPILLLLTLVGGSIAGGILALLPAWWQNRVQLPLLITTLLLNYIVELFASYLVTYPLRDRSGGSAVAETVMIPEAIRFGLALPGTRLHIGIVFVVILPLLVWWFFRQTSLGYKLRMTGFNPDFARYGGVNVARMTLLAMFLSGSIAGLAGVIQVLGVDYRFIDGTYVSAGFAWSGFIAAILALSNPLYIVGAGLFLAAIKVGAAGMQRNTKIPLQIADVIQAGIIFMVAVRWKIGDLVQRIMPSDQGLSP